VKKKKEMTKNTNLHIFLFPIFPEKEKKSVNPIVHGIFYVRWFHGGG